ncbi:thioredoxin family protein [Mycobacterium sp. 21AC1]|uniref:thioredoxin family protein n=1 Tax=[Mycobacterium] appelbergii TaxID=2939269 RepID=UPI00293909AD|nr:thioredoxin family protein [Mycobacterium sp. 21AC1]MDV3125622.1 thioredoxin family protein [Mycobacterium sp. 21AC1]
MRDAPSLIAFAREALHRTEIRWHDDCYDDPMERVAPLHWGPHTLAECFECEVWHTAQHTRQLAYMVEQAGVEPHDLVERRGLVLAQFWAQLCSPCHAMRPELERFAAEAPTDIAVCAVEISAHPRTTEHFLVSSVPSTVILRDGVEVHRSAGDRPGVA